MPAASPCSASRLSSLDQVRSGPASGTAASPGARSPSGEPRPVRWRSGGCERRVQRARTARSCRTGRLHITQEVPLRALIDWPSTGLRPVAACGTSPRRERGAGRAAARRGAAGAGDPPQPGRRRPPQVPGARARQRPDQGAAGAVSPARRGPAPTSPPPSGWQATPSVGWPGCCCRARCWAGSYGVRSCARRRARSLPDAEHPRAQHRSPANTTRRAGAKPR